MFIRLTSVLMLAMCFTACSGYNSSPAAPTAAPAGSTDGGYCQRRVYPDHDGVRSESADDRCWHDHQLVQQRQHHAHVHRRCQPVVVRQYPAGGPVQLHVRIGGTVHVPLPDSPEYGRHDRRAITLAAHCEWAEPRPTRRPDRLVGPLMRASAVGSHATKTSFDAIVPRADLRDLRHLSSPERAY